ncbi:dihydrofolate reductase [Fictibacillus phosphorivorans]|uniref:Dihydrofolate reductase n=1 Tax=Fictibacillus phosphorivorans TaxID=1221500 RepID=A0A160ILV5_9BACL|nr:dihydrofolate reductase [Fictibacillus phosphorivorans]ANC77213.1 dihydrofolate reductase [Fictibacillus phosphorivorans]
MNFSIIAAMDVNRVIGKDNDLPWRLPRDWKYVQEVTMGKTIVLGRKNFESIGRALPGRKNIVLTRKSNFSSQDCIILHSINDVLKICEGDEEVVIFGGEEIYTQFMPMVTKLYLTKIHHVFEGDTYFPEINEKDWKEILRVRGVKDQENPYTYYFHQYIRIGQ